MSFYYHYIYMDSGRKYDPKAEGLKSILIEIGKEEYRKKEKRARIASKSDFVFPSGKQRNALFYQVEGMNSGRTSRGFKDVPDDFFYKEGVYRINKNARMGQKNKKAIHRLVNSEYASVYGISHRTFKIHKRKTSRIYAALYRYMEDIAEMQYGFSVSDKELKERLRNM
ncbi:MAG: hypothetical protein LUD18_12005, partial [Lachnospiraceae bacterium]|nr:hypothetical protein [Lachnospiraceae bacterium]